MSHIVSRLLGARGRSFGRGHGLWTIVVSGVLGSCGPVAGEGDGVGSNTNWYQSCDQDRDCSDKLSCICGACSLLCATQNDCQQLDNSSCPIDSQVFRERCEPESALSGQSMCAPNCDKDRDCAEHSICLDGVCVEGAGCELVDSIVVESPFASLKARVGSLFGDSYYVPQRFFVRPGGWAEPFIVDYLTIRTLDRAGQPVEGCEISFSNDVDSGTAFAQNPLSNSNGEVQALWVAGTASMQTLQVMVESSNGPIIGQISGEARPHDAEPLSGGSEGRSVTHSPAVALTPQLEAGVRDVELEATVVALPASSTQVILRAGPLSLALWNRSPLDAAGASLPPEERTFEVYVETVQGVATEEIWPMNTCRIDPSRTVCTYLNAWSLSLASHFLVETRQVSYGQVPPDYETKAYSLSPCGAAEGCTDYLVSGGWAGAQARPLVVLRAAGVNTLDEQVIFLSRDEVSPYGYGRTCLETPQSTLKISHRWRGTDDWQMTKTGSSWGLYQSWTNQVCANYSVRVLSDGLILSAGGYQKIPTPTLPRGKNKL